MATPPVQTSYARAGLALALRAAGLGHGDTVLVPAYHCAAMVAPVVAGGFEVGFYEVGEGLACDPGAFGRKARAVLAVHYFGFPADLAAASDWCRRHGAMLIEDCTHLFHRPRDVTGGPGSWGDAVMASPYKFLPAAEGGLLWLRGGLQAAPLPRPTLIQHLRDAYRILENSFLSRRGGWLDPALSLLVRLRYLGRASPFEAAPAHSANLSVEGLLRLYSPEMRGPAAWSRRLAERPTQNAGAAERRANYERLAAALGSLPGIDVPPLLPGMVPFCLPCTLPTPDRAEALESALRRAQVRLQHFGLPAWPSMNAADFPRSMDRARRCLQLPVHQSLREADLDLMIRTAAAVL